MDFIGELASKLGVDEDTAKKVAGSALGVVQGAVADEDSDAADRLGSAIPEMDDWKAKAEADSGGDGGLLGGLLGGGGGDLLSGLAGAVGGQEAANAAALVGLISKFGIDADKATLAAPVILNFLKERVSPDTINIILKAAPFLGGGGEDGGDGGIGDMVSGALGGLFGGD